MATAFRARRRKISFENQANRVRSMSGPVSSIVERGHGQSRPVRMLRLVREGEAARPPLLRLPPRQPTTGTATSRRRPRGNRPARAGCPQVPHCQQLPPKLFPDQRPTDQPTSRSFPCQPDTALKRNNLCRKSCQAPDISRNYQQLTALKTPRNVSTTTTT